jgi:heme-degrading monooxygenase HmoA
VSGAQPGANLIPAVPVAYARVQQDHSRPLTSPAGPAQERIIDIDPERLSCHPAMLAWPAAAGKGAGIIEHMTVVKINAITVPADSGDELARRFAARAGAVDSQDGFEGFELLKPTDERTTWLVMTRWRDEASFQAWLHSPAFGHGHRPAAERGGGESAPVGVSSELWSYEIAGGSAG